MRKLFIGIVLILLLFVVSGCTSSTKSIYDDNNSSYDNSLYNADYPTKVITDNDTTNKSINTDMENYFKTNKITEYKYSTVGDKLQVWIADFNNMTDEAKTKIKNDLKQYNKNITDIEFVENKTDIK
jgi:gas vesicle protein